MCAGPELGIIFGILGGGAKAAGQVSESQSAATAAAYNADVARLQANDAIARGQEDVRRLRQQVAAMIGSQRATFSGQGVMVDTGTPLAVQVDTTEQSERDVITLRNNALREAWGYRTQAKLLDSQGSASKKAGSQAALGTLLGTAGTIYSYGDT